MKVQKLVPTEYDGKWGFIDAATGEEVVPFIYDYAHAFSVGLALVRQNGWWGYVDKTGKEVIPCIYNPAWSFTKTGLAAVCMDPFLASCTSKYKIEGTSSVNSLDGKMLYLKSLRDGEWVKLDSAEVVHGLFSMKGKIDSVQMVTLYMDEESIMPIVLESGKITVTISNTDLKAVGTSLNNALYEFISKRNQLEESISELEQKETRMVLDGGDLDEIHSQLVVEGDSLMQAMNQYVKTFISDNYENVLGPSVFMMLCSSLPYPIMTPQIDDIIKDAPYSFKDNKLVREFLSKARENMKLIEEHQRLEQNASTNK